MTCMYLSKVLQNTLQSYRVPLFVPIYNIKLKMVQIYKCRQIVLMSRKLKIALLEPHYL
jgi:hypothetical protein